MLGAVEADVVIGSFVMAWTLAMIDDNASVSGTAANAPRLELGGRTPIGVSPSPEPPLEMVLDTLDDTTLTFDKNKACLSICSSY